jgi:hypothetical protein
LSAHDEIRVFKRSIVAWTLRVAAVLLVVAAVIGRREIILGLAFGLCVGLINFDLMTRFNAALLNSGPGAGGRVAVLGTLVRLGVIFAGAVGVWYKGWSLLAAAVGCFSVYPVLIVHGLLLGRRRPEAAGEAEK